MAIINPSVPVEAGADQQEQGASVRGSASSPQQPGQARQPPLPSYSFFDLAEQPLDLPQQPDVVDLVSSDDNDGSESGLPVCPICKWPPAL